MMTLEEFNREVEKIADGKAFAVKVEVSTYQSSRRIVCWSAWINGRAWTDDHRNPEGVLSELNHNYSSNAIPAIGEL